MEPERLFALLWHVTEGRMTRREFMDLDGWTIANVMIRPGRNEEGAYWPEPRADKKKALEKQFGKVTRLDCPIFTKEIFKQVFFEMARLRGHKEEDIQERWERKHGGHG